MTKPLQIIEDGHFEGIKTALTEIVKQELPNMTDEMRTEYLSKINKMLHCEDFNVTKDYEK